MRIQIIQNQYYIIFLYFYNFFLVQNILMLQSTNAAQNIVIKNVDVEIFIRKNCTYVEHFLNYIDFHDRIISLKYKNKNFYKDINDN